MVDRIGQYLIFPWEADRRMKLRLVHRELRRPGRDRPAVGCAVGGGSIEHCGWLKDRYGVSWQIVPKVLGEMIKDKARARRVAEAMLTMTKFDIAGLKRAYDGVSAA